jgi:serine/threonine-protein kinase
MDTDRNLLFGVIALQADLLDQDQFVRACTLWSTQKATPLADLMVREGWLTPADRADVEKVLDRKLRKHRGDARAGLAEVSTDRVRQSLAGLDDNEVQKSLAGSPPPEGHVLLATTAFVPEAGERYTLSRLHATGGIGRVWLARDARLARDVALKELRPERAGNPAVWARFLQEARITGQLEHPGIVPIYEVGRRPNDQAPFYTMRFVRGRTLGEAGRAYHERRSRGEATPLELRELLSAFIGVCNAVAYAHSRGVLHRDLKPKNVILGDFGEVIVLDWGLARLITQPDGEDAAALEIPAEGELAATVQGQVLGTPAYMAPEQAEGRLDRLGPATDVYGLGAILYEVLTGQPPFSGAETTEVLRRVVHEAPVRPRHHVAGAPAALEAVCLKALAKKPGERYRSASELAGEVRHYLAGEPVSAYPEPWVMRARRWMGRHRTLVTSGAAALVVAVLSLTAATVVLADANKQTREARDLARELQHEAETQRDLAERRARETREQRDQAKANFRLARDAVEEYTTKVANDPRLKEKDLESLRQELLRSATRFFQKLTRQVGADAGVRADLGQAHRDLAYLARSTGDVRSAVAHGEKALAIFEKLNAEHPGDARFTRELARTCTDLGRILNVIGDAKRPPRLHRRAIRLLEGNKDPTARKYLAEAYGNLGFFLDDHEGEPGDVTETYARAVAVLEELSAARPGDVSQLISLGSAYSDLGWRYVEIGNPKKASRMLEKSVRTLRDATAKAPEDPLAQSNLSTAYHVRGIFNREMQDREAALADLRRSVAICRRLVAAHPSISSYQQGLARGLNNQATVHITFGENQEASALLAQTREIKEKIAARYPGVPDYQADLARTLQTQSQFLPPPEAEKALERARQIDEALVGRHPTVSLYHSDLAGNLQLGAQARQRARKWDEAEADCRRALSILTDLVARNPAKLAYRRRLAEIHEQLAHLYDRWNKPDQAEKSWRAALAVREAAAAGHPEHVLVQARVGRSLCNLAQHQGKHKQTAAAVKTFEEALQKLQFAVRKAPTNAGALAELSDAYYRLAVFQGERKDTGRAVETCRQLVQARRRIVDTYPEAPKYRFWLSTGEYQLGLLLTQAKRHDEAAEACARAAALQEKLVAGQPEVVAQRIALAATYGQQGILRGMANDAKGAVAFFEKEQAVRRKLVEGHPDVAEYQIDLARTGRKLGEFQLIARRLAAASASFRNAVALTERVLPKAPAEQVGPCRLELVQSLTGLGKACTRLGMLEEASTALGQTLPFLKQRTEQTAAATLTRVELAEAFMNLGEEYRKAGKVDPGAAAYRRAVTLAGPLATAHPTVARYQQVRVLSSMNLGVLFAMNNREPEALLAWRDSAAVLDQAPPSVPELTVWRMGLATNLSALAPDLAKKQQSKLATLAYRLAVEQRQKLVAAHGNVEQHRRELGFAHVSLANHLARTGDFQDSDTAFGKGLALLEKLAKEYPGNGIYPLMCAATLCDRGAMHNGWGKHDQALKHFDKALPLLDKILRKEKTRPFLTNARNFTRFNQVGRGLALRRLERYKEAISAYDKALALAAGRDRNGVRLGRALALAQAGDHARAVAEVEAVAGKSTRPGELYDAACALSLAAAAAGADTRLIEGERGKVAEQHAGRAVSVLRQAQKAGQFKTAAAVDHLKKDGDLEALRGREDYRKLLAELEAATKTQK